MLGVFQLQRRKHRRLLYAFDWAVILISALIGGFHFLLFRLLAKLMQALFTCYFQPFYLVLCLCDSIYLDLMIQMYLSQIGEKRK